MKSHPHVPHPHLGLSERFGDKINVVFGSMTTFWVLMTWQLCWMLAATIGAPLLRKDPYPFQFLLFLSNIIQLLALPVLGNTQNRADAKRDAKADADHVALTYVATAIDEVKAAVTALRDRYPDVRPSEGPTT